MANQREESPAMSVREAGRKGGVSTSHKYGREFYEEIGSKGGETTKLKHGPQFYSEIGRQGGRGKSQNNKDK